ncbi:putative holin-like toxin [Heyndrickxia sporothermodurans]
MTTYQALHLMLQFATLVLVIVSLNEKK